MPTITQDSTGIALAVSLKEMILRIQCGLSACLIVLLLAVCRLREQEA